MRHIFIIIICFLFLNIIKGQGQNATWYKDIAQIMQNNCVECHRVGGIAPFPLETYNDVINQNWIIPHVLTTGEMPPWPPDTTYQRYLNERLLSQDKINTVIDWIQDGMPLGVQSSNNCFPQFDNDPLLGLPDLKLTIPTYTSHATATSDDYVCFAIPTGLSNDRFIKAVEIIPGNPEIVHHVLVYIDETNTYQTDTSGTCMGPTSGSMLAAYAPGSTPRIFPNGIGTNMGVELPANSSIVVAMHYPEGTFGQQDSTSINIHFYPSNATGIREVVNQVVATDFGFCIQANTVDTVFQQNNLGIPVNMSLLDVFPHSHLIGKSWLVYALDPNQDTIKAIRINNWDFEWQDFYQFKNIVKIPPNSTINALATYDNTAQNPFNPNFPPQDICAGLNTNDEMFVVFASFTPYYPGDENLDLAAAFEEFNPTISLNVSNNLCEGDTAELSLNTNFSSYLWCPTGETTSSINVTSSGNYSVQVTNSNGSVISSNVLHLDFNSNPSIPTISLIGSNLQSSVSQNYQWYLNGNPISGANSQTFTPQVSGDYAVEVTNNNGCSNISDVFNYSVSSISNENHYSNIFPNPFKDKIFYEFVSNAGLRINIQLTDLVGNIILNQNYILDNSGYNKIKIELDKNVLSKLNTGLYSLSISSDLHKEYQKMFFIE